jgi:hypothetical protein
MGTLKELLTQARVNGINGQSWASHLLGSHTYTDKEAI